MCSICDDRGICTGSEGCLHRGISLGVQLAHVGMAPVGWFSSCKTSPAKDQCSTCSFYPLRLLPGASSGVLQRRLEQPAREIGYVRE